jgi:hypothetical protein
MNIVVGADLGAVWIGFGRLSASQVLSQRPLRSSRSRVMSLSVEGHKLGY